jgi:16S rRNA (cytosine1402-N4)-methyltransferase
MMTLEPPANTTVNTVKPLVHEPVMPLEVLEMLEPKPGKLIVDATLGGAGHTRLLLQAGASVIGVDQDPYALERVRAEQLSGLELIQSNFRDLPVRLEGRKVDAVLMDLGVSSFQLDDSTRGFSYHGNSPLDMRMSQSGPSAADAVNELDAEEIARILFEYGEERLSRRIARNIVEAREKAPIQTTGQLSELIRKAYPGGHSRGIHPSRRSFQALRMYVNDEIGALEQGLRGALSVLKPGGRLVVISFHSLEDRIVKRFVRGDPELQALSKRPLEPGLEEVARNPRSRSAKLRAAERIEPQVRTAEVRPEPLRPQRILAEDVQTGQNQSGPNQSGPNQNRSKVKR